MDPHSPYQRTRFHIKPRPTNVDGLRFFPNMEPEIDNDQDMPPYGWVSQVEVTDCNLAIVRSVVEELGDNLNAAMEIGVNRNGERSMSRIIMDERPRGSFYLGVDIEDKSYLDDPSSNTWTIKANSHDQDGIRSFMASKGIKKLDLLFIDGWHSINTCVNDWAYADMLSPHGIVLLHDTNSHPGPIGLFEAINDDLYIKERHCLENDFGIAVVRRRT